MCKGLTTLTAIIAALLLTVSVQQGAAIAQSQQSDQPGPMRFRAIAANLGNNRGPLATEVEINIQHWSTDGQRDRLLDLLRNKGQDALLAALQKQSVVGTIRTPDSLAYDLRYARVQPWDDGGQQVVLATDRYISFWEARNSARSLDYPFTVIQLRVNGEGKGEGKMSVATKVIAAGNQIVLENYDAQPVLLTDVTREK